MSRRVEGFRLRIFFVAFAHELRWFRVRGVRFKVQGLGFRVEGIGFRVSYEHKCEGRVLYHFIWTTREP